MSAAAHEGDIYPGMPSDVPLEVKTDGDAKAYVRMTLKNAPRTMAVYSGGHSNSEVGFLVRSNGAVKLDLRRDSNYKKYQPFQTAYISDTNNEWRYINFNLTVDCMLFIEATPMENPIILDFEMINFNSDEVSALKFKISEQDKQIITYAGRNTEKIYSAVCDDSDEKVRYTAANLPDGAAISSDSGKLTWNPDARSIGNHTLYITADNGKSIDVLCVNIHVAPDLQGALKYAGRKYNPDETYVSKTLDNYKEALKREDIDTIQKAADALELLNPCLSDGSLNYAAVAKSDDLKGSLKLFTDWDTKTFVSIFSDEKKFFTIDFGDSFRLKADSYAIQCRDGFPLRVKDTCILSSNDGIGWVTLTEKPAETSAEMQMLYVKAEEKNNAYRYIRVSKASDRILDIGEFRIYGDRIENEK